MQICNFLHKIGRKK